MKDHCQPKLLFFLSLLLIILNSCSPDGEVEPKELSKFIVNFKIGDFQSHINHSAKTIIIDIPSSTNITQLTPVIQISEGTTISPASGIPQNFTNPVEYTVTAKDNTTLTYTVQVNFIYGLEALTLKIGTQSYGASIDHNKKEIIIPAKFYFIRDELYGTENILKLESVMLEGFSITPAAESEIDLDNPPDIIVKASDNSTSTYKLFIKNSDNYFPGMALFDNNFYYSEDSNFAPPEYTTGLSNSNSYIIRVLSNVDITNLIPTFVGGLPENATVSPALNTPVNFSTDKVFTITSESGNAVEYTVRVIKDEEIILLNYEANIDMPIDGTTFNVVYRSISEIVSAKLVSTFDASEISCSITTISSEYYNYLYIDPSTSFPAGDYKLSVKLDNGHEVLLRSILY
jgi:hypothetical protein